MERREGINIPPEGIFGLIKLGISPIIAIRVAQEGGAPVRGPGRYSVPNAFRREKILVGSSQTKKQREQWNANHQWNPSHRH